MVIRRVWYCRNGRVHNSISLLNEDIVPRADSFLVDFRHVDNGRVGLGIIVRDAAGEVLASSAQRVLAGFSIDSAEAMAVCRGLLFTEDSGLLPVSVETDALVVVNYIKSEKAPLSDVGLIIDHTSSEDTSFTVELAINQALISQTNS
ncbi:hypothetical protein Dsin_027007 [Dipteronia sinensis]|uniref:RNase H type-1 domain-containing protein n=1 Tax=Dipteronia sinensis TaxID=43782 RepID=A0AAD9ZYU7_9ROSI|nr:hypothetical protein Dsin_027007 [Dipteronia sinensis]